MYSRAYKRGISFVVFGPPPASGCIICRRRWTLLLRYSSDSWGCWRPACRKAVRDFLAYTVTSREK